MAHWLARRFVGLGGWRLDGSAPPDPKYVLIAAPHTSNWDLAYMLAFAELAGIPKLHWLGKKSLFTGPRGRLLTAVGGVPVDRSGPRDMVQEAARRIREAEGAFVLAVPPSGTRGFRDYWKSGFYHIAREADVPVVATALDWGRKVGRIGPAMWLTGDVRADMDRIRAFYGDATGRFPANVSRIRLRAEDGDDEA